MQVFVEQARSGRLDESFHGLRDLGRDSLSALQAAHRIEADPIVRSILVRTIWEHRHPSTTGFLADALRDTAPEVWKEALDGLVTLASPAAKQALESARADEEDEGRRAWIEEAIGQVEDGLAKNEQPTV